MCAALGVCTSSRFAVDARGSAAAERSGDAFGDKPEKLRDRQSPPVDLSSETECVIGASSSTSVRISGLCATVLDCERKVDRGDGAAHAREVDPEDTDIVAGLEYVVCRES